MNKILEKGQLNNEKKIKKGMKNNQKKVNLKKIT